MANRGVADSAQVQRGVTAKRMVQKGKGRVGWPTGPHGVGPVLHRILVAASRLCPGAEDLPQTNQAAASTLVQLCHRSLRILARGRVAGKKEKWIQVAIYLRGPHAKTNFRLLERDKDEIEKALGMAIEWGKMESKKDCLIRIRKAGVDPQAQSDWPNQDQWFLENLERFHKVFGPRIKSLDAAPHLTNRRANESPPSQRIHRRRRRPRLVRGSGLCRPPRAGDRPRRAFG